MSILAYFEYILWIWTTRQNVTFCILRVNLYLVVKLFPEFWCENLYFVVKLFPEFWRENLTYIFYAKSAHEKFVYIFLMILNMNSNNIRLQTSTKKSVEKNRLKKKIGRKSVKNQRKKKTRKSMIGRDNRSKKINRFFEKSVLRHTTNNCLILTFFILNFLLNFLETIG